MSSPRESVPQQTTILNVFLSYPNIVHTVEDGDPIVLPEEGEWLTPTERIANPG